MKKIAFLCYRLGSEAYIEQRRRAATAQDFPFEVQMTENSETGENRECQERRRFNPRKLNPT